MIVQKTTKEILAESIQELAASKSVEKITIKEITQNCGMTSTTFYNHFPINMNCLLGFIMSQWSRSWAD